MLLYSTDLELSPARLYRLYRARFQIEFVFRDAKQHLGLNDGRARSQAKLHFHFNLVFAALFRARLQARLRAEGPLGPFSLRNLKRYNFEEEIHKRIGARSAAGRHAANAGAGRRRIPPERLWPRAAPLASGAGRPLNAAPGPGRHTGSSLKMCPNHRGMLPEPQFKPGWPSWGWRQGVDKVASGRVWPFRNEGLTTARTPRHAEISVPD